MSKEARESFTSERVVRLAEPFQLFLDDHPTFVDGVREYSHTVVLLDIGVSSPAKLEIGLWEASNLIITPLAPERGYRIDSFDYDVDVAGPYKLRQWQHRTQGNSDLRSIMLWDITKDAQTVEEMENVRLQLFIAGMACEAIPTISTLEPGEGLRQIAFERFYPLDSGPLPLFRDGGLEVGVALQDSDVLKTIRARFRKVPPGMASNRE